MADATQDRLDIRSHFDSVRKHGHDTLTVLRGLMTGSPWKLPSGSPTARSTTPRRVRQRYVPGQAAATVTRKDALPSVACRAVTVTWPTFPGMDRTNAPPMPP